MLETTILQTLEKLPESLKQEVLHYAEFLVEKHANMPAETTSVKNVPIETIPTETPVAEKVMTTKRRGFGSWQGQIVISDDFDEPLEDFQDYM
jgi:hypothetical protein